MRKTGRVTRHNGIQTRSHCCCDLDVVLKVRTRKGIGIYQDLSSDREDLQSAQAGSHVSSRLVRSHNPASDIE